MMRRFAAIMSLLTVALVATATNAGERTRPGDHNPVITAAVPASTKMARPVSPRVNPRVNPKAGPGASKAKPRHFSSANLGFTAAVPPGAEVAEREGTNQVSIRSRKGYVINIQVGRKRPEVPLARMSALLEPRYLGEGKPWSARGEESALHVFGLPAYNVFYRGASSKARVVVARGQINDYVFIFIAPDRAFPALEAEFKWVLANFQPNGQDRIRGQAGGKQTAPASMMPTPTMPASMMIDATPPQRFAEPGYGYAINYPAAWEISKPARMATIFSGREGSPEHAAMIGIQNIAPPGAQNPGEAAQRAFNQLKAALGNAVREFQVLEDRDWTYSRDGTTLVGRQLLVSYEHAGARFQKRMIVVPRPHGGVAHVWSYTAPKAQYANLQPIAERMLKSWTILTQARK